MDVSVFGVCDCVGLIDFHRILRAFGWFARVGDVVGFRPGLPGEEFRHAAIEMWWKCRWLCVVGVVCVDDVGLG